MEDEALGRQVHGQKRREVKKMTDLEKIEVAKLIATIAHRGQKDKSGVPYITHPEKVASLLDTPQEKIVGYLHDTVEDTSVEIEDIRGFFGDEIADAVALMTHADGEKYMDYVRRLAKNPLARRVKMADLTHNMDISRIRNPKQKDYDRIRLKYKPAYEYLKSLDT